jgi:predicted O-methyltransferase YrrM
MNEMRSSYKESNFGDLLYSLVLISKPVILVELGVLDGYSTSHIAKAVKLLNEQFNIVSKLSAFDLFEDYQYKHGDKEDVLRMLRDSNVDKYVNLLKGDAYKVNDIFADNSIEFLHVDISNTGKVIKDIISIWHLKLKERAVVCIEGGSDERDNIEWMRKYNMSPIKKELETNELINKNYFYSTYQKFPSMTIMIKR